MAQNFQYQKFIPQMTPTSADILGPFYKDKAPFTETLSEKPNLHLSGKVYDITGKPLKGVVLDFWHADEKGDYDLEGFKFRGKVKTDKDGHYELHTIVPGDYAISEDEFRCAHIHVKVSLTGFVPLTTQLYFKDDKYNTTDRWFDQTRVIKQTNAEHGTFDIVIQKKK